MKKQYIKPLAELVNVRLMGSMLDQGEVGGWSYVAAGDDPSGEYADANAFAFDADEDGNNDNWQRIGGALWEE